MTKHLKQKFVFLAGGLTGGPVMPLLAIIHEWQKHDEHITPILIDIKKSTSAIIAKDRNILFKRIITGKLRRYFAWQNFFAPFLLGIGFIQSLLLLKKYKPLAVLGAGGFTQIPLMFAAWILRIPRFIHQQDVMPTLSNQMCALVANKVTTTFEFSIRDFLQGTGLGKKYITTNKVIWTGNPVTINEEAVTKQEALDFFKLKKDLPVLLVLGGATGSTAINEIITEALPELSKVVQIIHATGTGKQIAIKHDNYQTHEYIEKMQYAYKAADVVLARAGISTLTELAIHNKPSIIIPMPHTHQELNADLLYQSKSAIVLDQSEVTTQLLIKNIRKILLDAELQKAMHKNFAELFPKHAANKIYQVISKYLDTSHGT